MFLPLGMSDFKELRTGNYYYVDKTHSIHGLLKSGGRYYFLSRPRRFGKSLLVSTLQCLFEGERELFKGLYIEDKWDWNEKYPVVRLSFGGGKVSTPAAIEKRAIQQLETIEEVAELTPRQSPYNDGPGRLADVIFRLYKKTGKKVVVLVDEYDKPILDMLHKPDQAVANRECLKEIYSMIKDCSDYVHFIFVTGITMFSKTSLFSGLNSLTDISLEPEFNIICGYTDHDIDTVFAEEIKDLDREEIRRWYNGYRWLGEEKVYNPYGVLTLFRKKKFASWWFKTGTPTYLYQYLSRTDSLNLDHLENRWVSEEELGEFEVDEVSPQALFFQSGYLTIAQEKEEEDETWYLLTYPNLEVRKGVYRGLLKFLGTNTRKAKQHGKELIKLLSESHFDPFKEKLHSFLASIPHQCYRNASLEGVYQSFLWIIFKTMGVKCEAEKSTYQGTSDLTLFYQNQIFVMELKMVRPGDNKDTVLAKAIEQIKTRGYAEEYKNSGKEIHLLGLAFSKEDRNVVDIAHEKLADDSAN